MYRRLALLLPLLAASVAVAVLVVQTAALRALPPAVVTRIAPDHPDLTLAAIRSAGTQPLPTSLADEVASAMRRAPLAGEPFQAAAVNAIARRDRSAAIRFLEESRRRMSRDRTVRLLLLDQYVRQSNVAAAANELIALSRLTPSASDLLVAQLAQLITEPSTRTAALRALRGQPLLEFVLAYLAANNADPDLILEASKVRAPTRGPAPPWQIELLNNLVQRGAVDRAHRLWAQFNSVPDALQRALVYDGNFNGLPGTPPFNWQLDMDDRGAAERSRHGGLEVDYFGRSSGGLARQLLLLGPGTYSLSMVAQGSHADMAPLSWTITCLGASEPLRALALTNLSEAPKPYRQNFTVPATGCPAQWLQLEGKAEEFPVEQEARISGLAIGRAGVRP